MIRILKIVLITAVVLYAADFLILRLRGNPTSTVTIDVYYAVRMKGKKIEYMPADPETETCTQSLFPQSGSMPCWYVTRHRQKWVEIGAVYPFKLPKASSISFLASGEGTVSGKRGGPP